MQHKFTFNNFIMLLIEGALVQWTSSYNLLTNLCPSLCCVLARAHGR